MLAELEQARRAWTRVSRDLTDKRKHGKRTCSKCKRLLGPDGFYKSVKRPSWCKECDNAQRRAWREANLDRDKETWRRYAARNPERKRAANSRYKARQWVRIKSDPVLLEQHRAKARARYHARKKKAA